jgi:transcriptional regulator with XRE-family HTH domain
MLSDKKELQKIGDKLKALRKAKGFTSHETFAYEFELSRVQYWRLENGKSNLTISSLIKLLNVHKISMEDFFATKPEAKKKEK